MTDARKEKTLQLVTSCPTEYIPVGRLRTLWHLFRYGHGQHACALHTPARIPHGNNHFCGCGFTWPVNPFGV